MTIDIPTVLTVGLGHWVAVVDMCTTFFLMLVIFFHRKYYIYSTYDYSTTACPQSKYLQMRQSNLFTCGCKTFFLNSIADELDRASTGSSS
jgi:hypothetical protein